MKSRRGKSLKSNPHPSTFELAAAERGPCGRKTVEIDGDRVNRKTSPVRVHLLVNKRICTSWVAALIRWQVANETR